MPARSHYCAVDPICRPRCGPVSRGFLDRPEPNGTPISAILEAILIGRNERYTNLVLYCKPSPRTGLDLVRALARDLHEARAAGDSVAPCALLALVLGANPRQHGFGTV